MGEKKRKSNLTKAISHAISISPSTYYDLVAAYYSQLLTSEKDASYAPLAMDKKDS